MRDDVVINSSLSVVKKISALISIEREFLSVDVRNDVMQVFSDGRAHLGKTITIKSSKFAVSFGGISRMGAAFIFAMIQTCTQAYLHSSSCSLHTGEEFESISTFYVISIFYPISCFTSDAFMTGISDIYLHAINAISSSSMHTNYWNNFANKH